jgi:hypothetical protein
MLTLRRGATAPRRFRGSENWHGEIVTGPFAPRHAKLPASGC